MPTDEHWLDGVPEHLHARLHEVRAVLVSDVRTSGAQTVEELKRAVLASIDTLTADPEIVVERDSDDPDCITVRIGPHGLLGMRGSRS